MTRRTAVAAWGLSPRKLALARRFLPDCELRVLRRVSSLVSGEVLALWGAAAVPPGLGAAQAVWRLEDGFLRSVGLGADLVSPLSWVVDRSGGIYFDPTTRSGLEQLLDEADVDPPLAARAAALRTAIVGAGLSKYNVGGAGWQRPPDLCRGRAVVLVPGQVESDASIERGCTTVRTNLALLQAVRAERPGAWLVYKPHPDVLAGLRSGSAAAEAGVHACCDEVVTGASIASLLDTVDEVHVMTSLAGFEALLRGKPVTTYGMPFYAGWGLTHDVGMTPAVTVRRMRRRSLDELVALTLIEYPRYADCHGKPSTPEAVLATLRTQRAQGAADLPWWRLALRPLLGWGARRRGG